MNSNKKTQKILENTPVNVKLKLSLLWVTMMILFAYGDIKSFFRPGIIEGILAGQVSGFEINQIFLLMTALSMVIPIVMIILSVVLKSSVNRWLNIIMGILYTAFIVAFMIGDGWAYYYFYSAVELVMTLSIIWQALKWPKQPVA